MLQMIYMGQLSKQQGNKDSVYDEVFKASLTEFHTNLITQISTWEKAKEVFLIYSNWMRFRKPVIIMLSLFLFYFITI